MSFYLGAGLAGLTELFMQYRPFYGSGRGRYRYPSWYEDPDYSPRRCYFA